MKNRKKIFFFLLTVLSAVLNFSCKKENLFDCLKSTGDVTTERRSISPFTEVEVHDNVNVIFVQDSETFIEVNAGENLLPLIKTELQSGTLKIENRNTCSWVRDYGIPINVYVHIPLLKKVLTYGSGKISSSNTLQCGTLEGNSRGTGDIELDVNAFEIYCKQAIADIIFTGSADYLFIFNTSSGFSLCSGLSVNRATVINLGPGNSYVNACDKLDVEIKSSGNIYYSGNPVLNSDITGSGQLIHQ